MSSVFERSDKNEPLRLSGDILWSKTNFGQDEVKDFNETSRTFAKNWSNRFNES